MKVRSFCSRRLIVLLGTILLASHPARGVTLPVVCDGMTVGNINAQTDVLGGVTASFTSTSGTPPTLAAAAAQCGEDHFNWYQVVEGDNRPPLDASGTRLSPPYVDPPAGGYSGDPTQTPPFPTLWADNEPWFYNEGAPPPAGTPGYDPQFDLIQHTTSDTLDFQDFPNGPLGTRLLFKTWLVSLNGDGTLHDFHGGFTWDFLRGVDGKRTILSLQAITTPPTRAEYQNIIRGFPVPLPAPAWLAGAGLVCVAGLGIARSRRGSGGPSAAA